jgi:hypothetical protein
MTNPRTLLLSIGATALSFLLILSACIGMSRGAPEQAPLLPIRTMVEDATYVANIEEHLDFDTLVPGHPPLPGTQADVAEMRQYLEGLIAAVGAAQEKVAMKAEQEQATANQATAQPAANLALVETAERAAG